MKTKHILFVLLSALCLVTVWAQPFDADIRQTADYKQGATWMPVLLRDTAAATRTNLRIGLPALTNTNVINFRNAIGAGDVSEGGEPWFESVTAGTVNTDNLYDQGSGLVQINLSDGYLAMSGRSLLEWGAFDHLQVNVPFRFLISTNNWIKTNAPANPTNVNRWIEVQVGTNSFRIPLYE
jgi:hypothetical protein